MNNKCSEKSDKLYYITTDDSDPITNINADVIYYTSFENARDAIAGYAVSKNLSVYKRSERAIKVINPDSDVITIFDINEIDLNKIINAHYKCWYGVYV